MPMPAARVRANNFDAIRLTLAAVVAAVHVAVLSGEAGLAWIPRVLSSSLAVKAFFVVSGFLIVMSFEHSANWRAYAERRVRRLYPAYAVVIVLSALALWLVSGRSAPEYFGPSWWKYVAANLAFLNFLAPTLPGVFDANAIRTVNGALWTLKVEVLFYAAVPFLVWLCRRAGWQVILPLAYLGSFAYVSLLRLVGGPHPDGLYEALQRQLPGQLAYFVSGAALYYGFSWFEPRLRPLSAIAALILLVNLAVPIPLVEPAAIAVVVIAIAFAGMAIPAGKYGDFSYGLYILHFPVIQLIVQAGWFAGRPLGLFITAMTLALLGAVLLWHLVEKRWLHASSHYRQAVVAR